MFKDFYEVQNLNAKGSSYHPRSLLDALGILSLTLQWGNRGKVLIDKEQLDFLSRKLALFVLKSLYI